MKTLPITLFSAFMLLFLSASSQQDCSKLKEENEYLRKALKLSEPIKAITADKIEFKLLKAEGNSKSQTITFTFVLTTSAANGEISSDINSIIDVEGNEYKLKSHTIGARDYGSTIELNTDVPLKCTYTFGGILPAVKVIRFFKFGYRHNSDSKSVEFRNVSIDWK